MARYFETLSVARKAAALMRASDAVAA